MPTKADKLAQRRVKISTIFKNVDFYDFKNVDFYDFKNVDFYDFQKRRFLRFQKRRFLRLRMGVPDGELLFKKIVWVPPSNVILVCVLFLLRVRTPAG